MINPQSTAEQGSNKENNPVKFALIGAAGYIAKRHVEAIKELGGELIAACDPHDNVGYLDTYFPECSFFTSFERFMRHCDKYRPDYVSICSPNYLHDSHALFCSRIGLNVILEKPATITPENLMRLKFDTDGYSKINVILQLRLHGMVQRLKKIIADTAEYKPYLDCNLTYITPRGSWYDHSWKGDHRRSGGMAVNIGIHLFDLCCYLFVCAPTKIKVSYRSEREIRGKIEFAAGIDVGEVKFFLSINKNSGTFESCMPWSPYRRLTTPIGDILFNDITNLHIESYRKILNGDGFTLDDIIQSTRLAHEIQTCKVGEEYSL